MGEVDSRLVIRRENIYAGVMINDVGAPSSVVIGFDSVRRAHKRKGYGSTLYFLYTNYRAENFDAAWRHKARKGLPNGMASVGATLDDVEEAYDSLLKYRAVGREVLGDAAKIDPQKGLVLQKRDVAIWRELNAQELERTFLVFEGFDCEGQSKGPFYLGRNVWQ